KNRIQSRCPGTVRREKQSTSPSRLTIVSTTPSPPFGSSPSVSFKAIQPPGLRKKSESSQRPVLAPKFEKPIRASGSSLGSVKVSQYCLPFSFNRTRVLHKVFHGA